MRILAFDTSTEWLSVAAGDASDWHLHEERAGAQSSERILPSIDRLLSQAGWRLPDLDAIAFGAGPGAFTGVRISCGVAQGLAFGADLPVVAVPTLEALAQGAWRARQSSQVFACMDARMREVYVAAYTRVGATWRQVREPAVVRPADVALPDDTGWHGVGDGFSAYPDLASISGLVFMDADAHPDARAIGELAALKLEAGLGVRADEAQPLYVRHRVALTSAERDAGQRL